MKLTGKQRKFCEEYLIDLNATKAAKRAGYSQKTARSQAQRLLTNVDIQEYLSKLQLKAREKSEINRERILYELEVILNAKITDYLTFDGTSIKFKSFSDLTEAQIKAIESIKEKKTGIELKLHGKSWTINRICKMLGYDSPQDIKLQIEKLSEENLDLIISKIMDNGKS